MDSVDTYGVQPHAILARKRDTGKASFQSWKYYRGTRSKSPSEHTRRVDETMPYHAEPINAVAEVHALSDRASEDGASYTGRRDTCTSTLIDAAQRPNRKLISLPCPLWKDPKIAIHLFPLRESLKRKSNNRRHCCNCITVRIFQPEKHIR